VKELRSIGLQPDILIVRSDHEIPKSARDKIALFTNVEPQGVVPLIDAETIYRIPSMLSEQGLDDIIVDKLGLDVGPADLSDWIKVVDAQLNPKHSIKLKMVGKYMGLLDAYKSLNEALLHAGIHALTRVDVDFIDSAEIEAQGTEMLFDADAILVPGGFGERGFEGKVAAARYARENKIPYLGICYGLHAAIVDIARNLACMENADTTENNPNTQYPVIALITEWITEEGETEIRNENSNLGGTMRMGEHVCNLSGDSLTCQIYGELAIKERHRHRYEVNNNFVPALEDAGLKVAGRSADNVLVEVVEYKDHPWFVACQFHPEFTSSPRDGHPLFTSFIEAALVRKNS
jgi:CTP synthase